MYLIAIVNLILSFYYDLFWGIICLLWNIIGFSLIHKKQTILTQNVIKLLWYLNFFLTPLTKNIVTFLYFNNYMTPKLTNILEHMLLSFGFFVLLFPIASIVIKPNKLRFFNYVFTFSTVNTLGILNEIVDFILLIIQNKIITNNHYIDTIIDLTTNLLGCALAIFSITIFKKINEILNF